MTSFVALLRGINVGGHKPVAMAELRAWAEEMGLREVRTLLQSGNLVFKSGAAEAMETRLEKEAQKRFGHEIDFMIRDAKEWRALMAGNPFVREAAADPGHLLVLCLKAKPAAAAVEALRAAIKGRDYFEVRGRELYVVYPDGIGRSKLTGAVMESKLATRATGRNWNTVGKIAALLGE